tara:strand:+ start:278 stop:799 length:522 start_codon:yes stop_codon:yes gene_type:complete
MREIRVSEITYFKYPLQSILIEYGASIIGIIITLLPLFLTTPLVIVSAVLCFLGALFFAYGIRAIFRHYTLVEISDTSIQVKGFRNTNIKWESLEQLKLSYFSTRRNQEAGWMQLRLKANNVTIRFDSSLEGFETILLKAAYNAQKYSAYLNTNTIQNLNALGLLEPETSNPV